MADMQTLHAAFAARIDAVLNALEQEGVLPAGISRANVTVEPPRDPAHGDLATNAAMVLAKQAATNPRALAEKIVAHLDRDPDAALDPLADPTVRAAVQRATFELLVGFQLDDRQLRYNATR